MNYDLEERTSQFGAQVIDFCKSVPKNEITKPLINQLLRAGTSVGANYMEAIDGSSKKIFVIKYVYVQKKHESQNIGVE